MRLPHDAAHDLGLKAYMADLGFDMSLQIFSDSSAARAFASRRSRGRQRHVHTRQMQLQKRVAASHLTVQKVKTTQNPADILTKAASRETQEKHRKMIRLRHVEGHRSQKELGFESLATDQMSEMKPIQLCAICGEPADIPWVTMSRTSTSELIRLWYCRGCWIDWIAQDNDANVNTVDEQELGASRCWSGLKRNSSFRRAEKGNFENEQPPIQRIIWSVVPCSRNFPENTQSNASKATTRLTKHVGKRDRT